MQCPRCNEEVLLAHECPYCGAAVPQTPPAAGADRSQGSRRSERPQRRDAPGDGAERSRAARGERIRPGEGDEVRGGRDGRRGEAAETTDDSAELPRSTGRSAHGSMGHRGTFRGRMGGGMHERADRGGQASGSGISLKDVWSFFTSGKVGTWKKLSPLLLLFYILSPLDFVPDVIPLLGWFDDVTIAAVAWRWLSREIMRSRTR